MALIQGAHQLSMLLLAHREWLHASPLSKENTIWLPTQHVIFKNQRNHKALVFALDYVVIELAINDLLVEQQFLRMIACYSDHMGILMNSVNTFHDTYPQTHMFSAKAEALQNPKQIRIWANTLLKQKLEYSEINFWRFIPPYHKSQMGHWESIAVDALIETPQHPSRIAQKI